MTQMDILRKIVETENNARSIYTEAVSLQADFESYVQVRKDRIKEQYKAQAESEIAQAALTEKTQADSEIQEMDMAAETALASAKNRFESQRQQVVDRIFKLAVEFDA